MKRCLLLCLVVLSLGLAGCETAATSDVRPVARIRIAPVYPLEMRRMGMTGEAVVEFIVDTNGDVVNPVVIRATNDAFGQAAAASIARWKFHPAMKNGRAVNSVQQQTMTFSLNEN